MPAAKPQKKRMALTKKADALFGKIIRASGHCINCGTTEVIQAAHGFSRRYLAVRWDERNCFALCRREHMHFTHHPLEWDEWLHNQWGDPLYNELRRLALDGRKPDFDELIPALEARLAEVSP